MKSPLLLMVSLIGTLQRDHLCYDRTNALHDLQTIRARFKHEGMGFLSKTLPSLEAAILAGLQSGTFTCPTSFRKRKDGALPLFLTGLLDKMFEPKSGKLLDFDPLLLKNIRQLLVVFKKVQLSPKNFQVLSRKAELDFLEQDGMINDESFENVNDRFRDVLGRLSQIVLSEFSYSREAFRGKNGPGAVCEGLTPNGKWELVSDASLVMQTSLVAPISELQFKDGHDGIFTDLRSMRSKLISVPKNSTSVRLITVEPCMNQFIQGGLNLILRDYIKKSKILRQCLDLTDQAKSQELAQIGSISGNYSTIDLSSASDTIDSTLVHSIFRNHQSFLNDLMIDARTGRIDVSGRIVYMSKFAGMGNATTFPIMSIVFSLLILGAMFDKDGQQPSYWGCMRYAPLFRVYGDDIAVPSEYSSRVLEWLTAFGFRPNRGKSFTEGNFRESCGADMYKGVNVTPIYIRLWPEDLKKTDASALASLVATSNQFWLDFNHKCANVISEYVESVFGRLPLVSRDSEALGWHTHRNWSTIERWNKTLHRFEHRSLSIKTRKIVDKLDGIPALVKFFHTGYDQRKEYLQDVRPDDHLDRSSKRYSTRIARGWSTA